ncbi:hypothetical protein [Zhihengliuella sp. ISTPL4]|uniref:hypothetical protein n=1 Tax=Zhihengliuella sp. ISTPL4 TaxID=2058657 RepID=UPI000C7B1ACB|nr:hypothetical protein [Zhihengliuella sp. ISTPL4]
MATADDDGVEERRALQRKAFGRAGGLTAAEAARLRELDDARQRPATPPTTEQPRPDPPQEGRESRADHTPPVSEPEAGAPRIPEHDAGTAEAGRDRRWRSLGGLALAAVVVLLVGVGIGWLAFGRGGGVAVALSAEQQQWQSDLVTSGKYDPGSVRAVATEEDAVVWVATQNGGASICLVLGAGESTTPSCNQREAVQMEGLWGEVTTQRDDEYTRQVLAQLLLTADGEPAVTVGVSEFGSGEGGGLTYANEAESRTAERLADEGFDPPSIWVVGYDRDVPIWTASERETGRQCLIYDGATTPDAPRACETTETLQEHDGLLRLQVTDVETGGMTTYELPSGGFGSFVIIREGSDVGAGGD